MLGVITAKNNKTMDDEKMDLSKVENVLEDMIAQAVEDILLNENLYEIKAEVIISILEGGAAVCVDSIEQI